MKRLNRLRVLINPEQAELPEQVLQAHLQTELPALEPELQELELQELEQLEQELQVLERARGQRVLAQVPEQLVPAQVQEVLLPIQPRVEVYQGK